MALLLRLAVMLSVLLLLLLRRLLRLLLLRSTYNIIHRMQDNGPGQNTRGRSRTKNKHINT